MTHLKRIAMPKSFPVRRKGREKFIVSSIGNAGTIPLLLILRDVCKLAKTRKEAKILLRAGDILVNGKKADNEKLVLHLFDRVTVSKLGKTYKVIIRNKKFCVEEADEKEALIRICKIIGKRLIPKGKVQFNLDNGYNIISDLKARVNDSVIFDFKTNKIVKHLPFKEGMHGEIIGGSHTGARGAIIKIEGRSVEIKTKEGIISVPIKNIRAVEDGK